MLTRRAAAWAAVALVLGGVVVFAALRPGSDTGPRGGKLTRPIDPRQQTLLAFGERSHWLQPWRAYLDTPPATRLRDAIGINFNVEPGEAEATARLLSRSGFRRARVEFGWDSLSPGNPARLKAPRSFRTMLGALDRHGIRPLILLNAHHGAPGPTRFADVHLSRPARTGARHVWLTRASARRVRPGRTGLSSPEGKAADVLFTSVRSDGRARLSKPLPRDVSAGDQPAATLLYEPFGPPRLRDGRPNPRFLATLRGWLAYARTIVREAQRVLGHEEFDVEIWNELSFGSDFLYQERYYEPPRERGKGEVTEAILDATVPALRAESRRIGITNGFASQTPFPSGATGPRGLTAISKHPYYGMKRFPADATLDRLTPLDARGRPDYREVELDGETVRRDRFVPEYDAFFPEYILSGIQTETLVRDLSPITTEIYGTQHGRKAHPRGGRPPTVWITEANLDPTGADVSDPANVGRGAGVRLSPRDVRHLHAKAALRYYAAFVNKGVDAVHLFAVKGGGLALVDPAFFTGLKRSRGAYPGDRSGGETMRAVGRLTRALSGARRMSATRPLSLQAVADAHNHRQFQGDGTRAHPDLHDRDVLAFLPFQMERGRYLAAVYVMTRSLLERHGDSFDLPEAKFRLTVGGLARSPLKARATDPLTGRRVPVTVRSRSGDRATLELPLTDSARLLSLDQR